MILYKALADYGFTEADANEWVCERVAAARARFAGPGRGFAAPEGVK